MAKTSQTRQHLLFRGFMRLRLRNSGLRPSNSLAATVHFISRNHATVSDGLLMSSPYRIISYTTTLIYYIMNPAELKLVFVVVVAVPAQLVFAKNDLDRAQLICPQVNDLPDGQMFQCILCRMTVPVVFSAGDYSAAGPDVC